MLLEASKRDREADGRSKRQARGTEGIARGSEQQARGLKGKLKGLRCKPEGSDCPVKEAERPARESGDSCWGTRYDETVIWRLHHSVCGAIIFIGYQPLESPRKAMYKAIHFLNFQFRKVQVYFLTPTIPKYQL